MLAFLHTAHVHVETFGLLAQQLDASIPVRHEVRPSLLATALIPGVTTTFVQSAVSDVVHELARDGAKVVLCTCSTIGGAAETTVVPGCTVLRIDRPVAETAIASGRRILLVAALPTALEQTRALLREVAALQRHSPKIIELLCEHAWNHFSAGDTSGYLTEVVNAINSSVTADDVVLLAQASMAPVAQLIHRSDIAVLSSPALGVAAAFAAYRRHEAGLPQ